MPDTLISPKGRRYTPSTPAEANDLKARGYRVARDAPQPSTRQQRPTRQAPRPAPPPEPDHSTESGSD